MTPEHVPATVAVAAFLTRAGLLARDEELALEPLTGGVSSDIWRVATRGRTLCVKRALPQLRTADPWHVPVTRNASEHAWLQTVAAVLPSAVPRLLAHDEDAGMFAMAYLEPAHFPVWKAQLRDGVIDAAAARDVGDRLGTIHAATADDAALAGRFANDELFFALRLRPYLLAAADKHDRHAARLRALAASTAATRRVLVHGDVSPKNLLMGPTGAVFLDAECACYGDPAFDLAFVLNHLLLKCVWRPDHRARYLAAFRALAEAYLAHVDWEPAGSVERRAARLLPALALARVDGTSPVEYLTDPRDVEFVRAAAGLLLSADIDALGAVAEAWQRACTSANRARVSA